MKVLLIYFGLTGLALSGCKSRSNVPALQQSHVDSASEITVHADRSVYPIHPHFWGTNFLYWIEDDAALQNGKIVDSLKDMGVQLLRYPGGTVADNFHWETNTLENVNMFPYESGPAETSFDEFITYCRKIGAEPSCVLNTETWAVKNDIAGGAHEAANWLRYCKRKGYKVTYWEIGNETYWHPVMSASEYADLVNVYVDSLRKVDPNIVIGINGHWNVDFVSTKERIKPEAYDQLMIYRRNIDSRENNERYQEFKEENTLKPISRGDIKWWETVAKRCGANVDMIIIHWYFSLGQLPEVSDRLLEVRSLFSRQHPNKHYLFNVNEYNLAGSTKQPHTYLTEMIGAMLKGQIDMTAFWPMRMRWSNKLRLLDYQTSQHSIMFEIHRQLSQYLKGALVESDAPDSIPTFASSGEEGSTVVLTGSKISKPVKVGIKIVGKKATSCSVWRISGEAFDYQKNIENVVVNKGRVTVQLAPGEVLVAVLN